MFLTAGNVQSIATNFASLLTIATFHTAKIRKISVRRFFLAQKLLGIKLF